MNNKKSTFNFGVICDLCYAYIYHLNLHDYALHVLFGFWPFAYFNSQDCNNCIAM